MSALTWLEEDALWFPDPECALTVPDGLLAVGGDLSAERLLLAYQNGIFPWFEESQPILWWSPNPRSVLFPEKLHISRSLQKTLNKQAFQITFDTEFEQVIESCAQPRRQATGTWITNSMRNAYTELYQRGFAHSVEVWQSGKLVGGLYGIAMGKVFFGESMFSTARDASKVGFATFVLKLRQWGFRLVDCQIQSGHLDRFGAELLERKAFIRYLNDWLNCNPHWDS